MWSVRKSKERNINIVGVCETKWENKENLVTDRHRYRYAGGKKNDGRFRLEKFIGIKYN